MWLTNIRGLRSNFFSFLHRLSISSSSPDPTKPDIICFTETFLTPFVPDSALHLPGYVLIRRDRECHGGGILVYVRVSLQPHNVYIDTQFEVLWFTLGQTSTTTKICLAYCPPSSAHLAINSIIGDLSTQAYNTLDPNVIICGDFNCPGVDWNKDSFPKNATGDALNSLICLGGLHQCVRSPTRISPTGSHSLLDLILTCHNINCATTVDAPIGSSDHALVKCSFNISTKSMCTQRTRRLYHLTHCANFNNYIIDSLKNATGLPVTSNATLLTDTLSSAINHFVPSKTVTSTPGFNPWVDQVCFEAWQNKESAYHTFINHPSERNWSYFKSARNRCSSLFKKAKADYLYSCKKKLCNLKNKPRAWWLAVKMVSGKIQPNNVPPLKSCGVFLKEPVDKANALKNAFVSATSTLHEVQIDSSPPPMNTTHPLIKFHTESPTLIEISTRLRTIANNAAAGPDHISSPPIIHSVTTIAPSLQAILHASWNESCFPAIWKCANVVPIPKSGRKDDPLSYRPISLTPILGKITEECMLERLNSFLEDNNILHPSQFGFRKASSSFAPLLLITQRALNSVDVRSCYCLVTLDFKRAFDSVWHKGLLAKLTAIGVPSQIVSWFASFLAGRTYRVVTEGATSEPYLQSGGVPQGSVLGPTLFCIFINDLLSELNCETFCFADDLAVALSFHPSEVETATAKLQKDIDIITQWSDKWLLPLNPTKCSYIFFYTPATSLNISLTINNIQLKRVHEITYLGITICSNLTWAPHISLLRVRALRQLACLICSNPYLTQDAALNFYKSFVRSALEYCSPLWSGAPISHLSRIDSIQARALNAIFPSNHTDCTSMQSLHVRRIIGGLAYLHNMVHGKAPSPLKSICPPFANSSRNTRAGNDKLRLVIPSSRTEKHKSSFIPLFSRLWNHIPCEIRMLSSLSVFKKRLNSHFKSNPPPPSLFGSNTFL